MYTASLPLADLVQVPHIHFLSIYVSVPNPRCGTDWGQTDALCRSPQLPQEASVGARWIVTQPCRVVMQGISKHQRKSAATEVMGG